MDEAAEVIPQVRLLELDGLLFATVASMQPPSPELLLYVGREMREAVGHLEDLFGLIGTVRRGGLVGTQLHERPGRPA